MILKFPDPRLRGKAREAVIGNDSKQIVSVMKKALRQEPLTAGLAAPQLGIPLRIILIREAYGSYLYYNPKILRKEGEQVLEEGCLSCPDVFRKVKRAFKIEVEYQDRDGKRKQKTFVGQPAMIFQHEYDHLEGRLIIDYPREK